MGGGERDATRGGKRRGGRQQGKVDAIRKEITGLSGNTQLKNVSSLFAHK